MVTDEALLPVLTQLLSPFAVEKHESLLRDDDARFALIKLANKHWVLSVFYHSLQTKQLTHYFTELELDYFKDLTHLNAERNAAIVAELQQLHEALQAVACKPVYLKGAAALLGNWYGDAALRFMADIDVLVGFAQVKTVAEKMLSLGYTSVQGEKIEESFFSDAIHQLPPLSLSGSVIEVDVHKAPFESTVPLPLQFDEIALQQQSIVGCDGQVFCIPSPTHAVAIAIVHAEVHGLHGEDVFNLRKYLDIVYLFDRYGDEIHRDELQVLFEQGDMLEVLQKVEARLWRLFSLPLFADNSNPVSYEEAVIAHKKNVLFMFVLSSFKRVKVGFSEDYLRRRFPQYSDKSLAYLRYCKVKELCFRYSHLKAWKALWRGVKGKHFLD